MYRKKRSDYSSHKYIEKRGVIILLINILKKEEGVDEGFIKTA